MNENSNIVISVIIVSWNVSALLKRCLHSLISFSKLPIEIFVVDNASRDATLAMLSEMKIKFLQESLPLHIIVNEANIGFSRANNIAIKKSRGKYILLLNPDAEIMKNTLITMVQFFHEHGQCAIAGCKILNPDNTQQLSVRNFPEFFSQALILLKLHHIFPLLPPLKKYFRTDFDYSVSQEIEQPMGAFFMFEKKLIEQIGYFDENFHLWFEEVDFCKRAEKIGLKNYYVADASILHWGGSSFKQLFPLKKQRIFNASLLYYFKKHNGLLQYFALMPFLFMNSILTLTLMPFMRTVDRKTN